jgi:hypothetical protein
MYIYVTYKASLSPESESYITTERQSASLSWSKAPVWGLRPDFYYCQAVADLLMWSAISDERTGLPFTVVPGPLQRSHFRVRIQWDSWQYFTGSDWRLPFSSPPTTRRATVEVIDPSSTREIASFSPISYVSFCSLVRTEDRTLPWMVRLRYSVYSLPRECITSLSRERA